MNVTTKQNLGDFKLTHEEQSWWSERRMCSEKSLKGWRAGEGISARRESARASQGFFRDGFLSLHFIALLLNTQLFAALPVCGFFIFESQ